jgi:hypothetical protein
MGAFSLNSTVVERNRLLGGSTVTGARSTNACGNGRLAVGSIVFSDTVHLSFPLSRSVSQETVQQETWRREMPSSQSIEGLQQTLRETWNGASQRVVRHGGAAGAADGAALLCRNSSHPDCGACPYVSAAVAQIPVAAVTTWYCTRSTICRHRHHTCRSPNSAVPALRPCPALTSSATGRCCCSRVSTSLLVAVAAHRWSTMVPPRS